ncbi:MAG: flagellar biosynthetic protein FliQ [Candidatus Lariskella arthropodorum]
MEPSIVIDISREALVVLFKLAIPLLLVALVVGLFISLLQALTQIQEPSLAFVPKIFVMLLTLFIMLPYIGVVMGDFSEMIYATIIWLTKT